MTEYTDNYGLNKYSDGDAANLRDQYNASMDIIDGQMKSNYDNSTYAKPILDAAGLENAEAASTLKQKWEDTETILDAAGLENAEAASTLKQKWEDTETTANNNTNKIKALEKEVSNIKTTAIYIGNSFTDGVGSESSQGLFARTGKIFDRAWKYDGSGTGFLQYAGHASTFLNQLQQAYSEHQSEADSVTDIIVISAMGDSRYVYENYTEHRDNILVAFSSALLSFYGYANANFPNATIRLVLAEGISDGKKGETSPTALYITHDVFRKLSYASGISYCGWIGWEMVFKPDCYSADGYHPNDMGYRVLAATFMAALNGTYTPSHYYVSGTSVGDGEIALNGIFTQDGLVFNQSSITFTLNQESSNIIDLDLTGKAFVVMCYEVYQHMQGTTSSWLGTWSYDEDTGHLKLTSFNEIPTSTGINIGQVVIHNRW